MSENLSSRIDNFAIYLPAVQLWNAELLAKGTPVARPLGPLKEFKNEHLDFLEPANPYWHYAYGLASAGHMANTDRPNCVTQRDVTTVLLGDSGGYQIGTGALNATSGWLNHQS